MVHHLDQTERVDRELNVVKRARFNQTFETYKTNKVPEPKFGVEPHTVKELPALPVRNVDKTTCYYTNKFKITC